MPISKAKRIFGGGMGGPAENYRIPSMVVTKSGMLVACADARYFTGNDNPNRIDKVIRRSADSGETWGEFILAVSEHGESKEKSSAAIDPVMVYVPETNRIYMMYCHTPAGVGILNCRCTRGEDEKLGKLLFRGKKKYYLRGGVIYDAKNRETSYTADGNGNVFEGEREICNIYTGGEFGEAATSFLMVCYSDDEGLTWSKPRSLNLEVKEERMSFIGPGPGVGIVIKEGGFKGRIVMPVYYGTHKWPLTLSCACIYSDDMGESWHMGASPNNTRKIGMFKANDKFTTDRFMLTESQLIELPGGGLKYFMRNHSPKKRVATAESPDGGKTWQDFHLMSDLPQPICQLSVITLKDGAVVFLNPASEAKRENGVVRLSYDGGKTFPYSRVLKEGPFVYSSLAELPDGTIGALYEPDLECRDIDFVKFTVDWIKEDEKDA